MSFMRNMFGPPDVAQLLKKRDIEGLVKALAYDKDPAIPRDAAKALISVGKQAAPFIAAEFEEHSPSVRRTMVMILGRIGGMESVKPLLKALGDDNAEIRGLVVKVLVSLGKGIIKPALSVLKDGPPAAQSAAADILVNFPDPRLLPGLMSLWRADHSYDAPLSGDVMRIVVAMGEPAVEPLIEYIQKYTARPAAVWPVRALGHIGGERAMHFLIEAMPDEQHEREVRYEAAIALGTINNRKAVPSLIEVLNDKQLDWYLRGAAARALGELRDKRAIPHLNNALDGRFNTGHAIAREALEKIENSPEAATITAEEFYNDGDWWTSPPHDDMVVEALTVIGCRLGDRVDSADINEAMKVNYIRRDALIYMADTAPKVYSDEQLEAVTIDVAKMAALKAGVDWDSTDWALVHIDSRLGGQPAIVISSGLEFED